MGSRAAADDPTLAPATVAVEGAGGKFKLRSWAARGRGSGAEDDRGPAPRRTQRSTSAVNPP